MLSSCVCLSDLAIRHGVLSRSLPSGTVAQLLRLWISRHLGPSDWPGITVVG
jgi:hypothetical protein